MRQEDVHVMTMGTTTVKGMVFVSTIFILDVEELVQRFLGNRTGIFHFRFLFLNFYEIQTNCDIFIDEYIAGYGLLPTHYLIVISILLSIHKTAILNKNCFPEMLSSTHAMNIF